MTAYDDAAWQDHAVCAGHPDPDLWFPRNEQTERRRQAVAICRTCPVTRQCLAYALANNFEEGIWGGLTAHRRRRLHPTSKEHTR